MKQYLIDTFNKWQAGRSDQDWNRLGKIHQERLKDCKTELNWLLKAEDSVSLKDKIAISKSRCFSEIKELLTR